MRISQSTYVEVIIASPLMGNACTPRVVLGNSVWQNPVNRFDVNNDGLVNLSDYNTLVSYLDTHGAGQLPSLKPDTAPFVDVDGDGSVTSDDVAQLAQYLATGNPIDRTPETCFPIVDVKLERDLLAPNTVNPATVKSIAALKGLIPTANYTAFRFSYIDKTFFQLQMSDATTIRDCIVLVPNSMITTPKVPCAPEPNVLSSIRKKIANYEILPSRQLDTIPTSAQETLAELVTSLAIIIIVDEADVPYVGVAQNNATMASNLYQSDMTDWSNLLLAIAKYGISVQVCLLQPAHYRDDGSQWAVKPALPWPGDSNRSTIDDLLVGADPTFGEFRTPRVLTQDIIDAFTAVSANYNPTWLTVVKDNSGSIQISDYQSQLAAAEAQLQLQYPLMKINDIIMSSPERWVQVMSDTVRQIISSAGYVV